MKHNLVSYERPQVVRKKRSREGAIPHWSHLTRSRGPPIDDVWLKFLRQIARLFHKLSVVKEN